MLRFGLACSRPRPAFSLPSLGAWTPAHNVLLSAQSNTKYNITSTIFITGCPEDATSDELKGLLPCAATISRAKVGGKEPPRFRAAFKTAEAAHAVLDAHHTSPMLLRGNTLSMSSRKVNPPSPVLYVSNIPDGTTQQHLADAVGVPLSAIDNIRRSPAGKFSFIQLTSTEDAQQVFDSHHAAPKTLGGHELDMDYKYFPPESDFQWLSVRGMSRFATREQVADALGLPLAALGPICSSWRGAYVHVTAPSAAEAQAVIKRLRASPARLDGAPLFADLMSRGPPTPTSCLKIFQSGYPDDVIRALHALLRPFDGTYRTQFQRVRNHKRENADIWFITFNDVVSATRALEELVRAEYPNGKPLQVAYASFHPRGPDRKEEAPVQPAISDPSLAMPQ